MHCDDCDHWYPVPCMNMNPEVYKAVAEHSSLTWICCNCGLPSFSFFSTTPINVGNSFASLDSSIDLTSSPLIGGDSPKCPLHIFTPKGKGKPPRTKDGTVEPLRLLNINFQSYRNKIQELEHLVNSVRPDVIIGTETWVNPTISSAEIMKAKPLRLYHISQRPS